MRQGRLARSRAGTAADDRRGRRAVMRGAKRRASDERTLRRDEPGDRMDAGHLERLGGFEQREDPGQPSREHRLAVPGGPASSRLCRAAANSRARRARSWPRTSARSGSGGSGGCRSNAPNGARARRGGGDRLRRCRPARARRLRAPPPRRFDGHRILSIAARVAPSATTRTPPTRRTAVEPQLADRRCSRSRSAGISRDAARIASTIVRSKAEPSLRSLWARG